MSYTTTVISIGSLNVEAGSGYAATLVQSFVQPDTTISRVQREADSSVVTYVAPGLNEYYLEALVVAAGVAADTIDARRRALLAALDTSRGPTTVVIENATGTARQRYMQVVVAKVDQIEDTTGSGFAARLQPADDVRWRSLPAEEVTWTIADTPAARSLTVLGDLDAQPVITITPTDDKADANWLYRRLVVVRWRSPYGGLHPIDVTGGGLNTAALVSGGKVTDGTNMAVMMDGSYRPYWYGAGDGVAGGFNTSSTRMWINMTFAPRVDFYANDYLSETTTSALAVRDDSNLPPSGYLLIEDEIVSYGHRASGYLYQLKRGLFGTTAAEHLAGTEINHIHVGYILYGPNGAVPESAKDWNYTNELGPVFRGTNSSNATWYYDDFTDPPLTGGWLREHYLGGGSAFVDASLSDGTYSTEWVYPWTALGFRPGWASMSRFRARFAVPIKRIRVLGRRYALGNPAQYTGSAKLMVTDEAQAKWSILWDSANGAGRTPNPTFDVTPADITPFVLTSEYNQIVWGFNKANYVQADIQQMYVTFQDLYTPEVTVYAEGVDYDLDVILRNTTTGEQITVEYPNMAQDESIVIDSKALTAVYEATGANLFTAVRRNSLRPYYLKLVPGENNFTIQEDGIGEIEIEIRYEPRWYT